MKIHAILILLLLSAITAYPQSTFMIKTGNFQDEMPFCIKQIGEQYFMPFRLFDTVGKFWYGTKIVRIDKVGTINKEIEFEYTDSSYYDITSINQVSESEFLAIGGCKNSLLPVSQFWILKMDTALNIIWEKKFMTTQPYIGVPRVIRNPGGNFLLGTVLVSSSPQFYSTLMFLEITEDGDSVQSKIYLDGNVLSTQISDLIWMNGGYKAFVDGFSAFTNNNCFSQILQIDTNLNLTAVRPVPYFIQGTRTAKLLNDSIYYLTGQSHFNQYKFEVSIAKLSDHEDSIAFNHAGYPGKIDDYSGWLKCMSFTNHNNIFTGGTEDAFGPLRCEFQRTLMLSNYDSLLNCRWTRFYGGDECYTFNTLDATSDGGCIIAGMYYDVANPENLLDLFVVKVDSSGLFTGISDKPQMASAQAIVYPNPGQDYLVVQSGPQISGSVFMLFDANGCCVLETTLQSTTEQRDMTSLPSGVYIWRIANKGESIEDGKWIKK